LKKYFFLFLLIVTFQSASAQFVVLPDSNFLNYISQNIDSNAVVANKLDTTNINVISLKTLEIYYFNNLIQDLEGIRYFDSLEVLKINFLYFTQLPILPPLLKRLEAQANAFQSLPPLPNTLEYLDVSYNEITSINSLPPGLKVFYAGFNHLSNLPSLSDSLIVLHAQGNEINYISSFPDKLLEISLWDNRLDSLGELPDSLQSLNVSSNRLKRLPALPTSLTTLFISYNGLQEFPALPSNLQYMDCAQTISCLPVLPNSIVHLNFDGCLSNRPTSMVEYYPLCSAPVKFTEVADTAAGICNDTLQFNTGFISYLWNTGATTNYLANICRGTYTCTLTDTLGCYYFNEIDISDTVLSVQLIVNTELSCNQVGICGYVADLSVTGGTPPYRYKWSGANGEIDFSIIADSTQDLVHFCLSDVLTSELLKCVITDAAGRKDSVTKNVFDNLPPEPYYVDIVNPVCAGFATGYIYLEDDPLTPGGNIFIMETGLDAGQYIYTVPFGNGCEQGYTINLEYQFKECENMYSYDVVLPDSAVCNGVFGLIDNVDHGIYNLGNTDIAYDGMYLIDGTFINPTDLCIDTWYYFFVYDFNIGYFVQDSIYIQEPQYFNVYPGDANNDGTANNLDLLFIGVALNESGFSRTDNTITWDPKPVQNWMSSFADSTNMAYADCNGDGFVKASDVTAILLNYNQQHSRNTPHIFNALFPTLYIKLPDTVVAGSDINIPVVFGDSLLPVDSLLGVAFTMTFDSMLVDASSVIFVPDSSWFGKAGDDLIELEKIFPEGYAEVGYTRNDHVNRSGYGMIGHLHFKIQLVTDTTYLVVSTSDITYTNQEENYRIANGDIDSILIFPPDCFLQTSLNVTKSCDSFYGGTAEVAVTNATGSVNYLWSLPAGSTKPYAFDQGMAIQDSMPSALYQVVVVDSIGCRDSAQAYVSSEDGRYIYSEVQNPTCAQLCNGWIWLLSDTVNGPAFSTVWNTGKTNAINSGLCRGLYIATIQWGQSCYRSDTFQLKDPLPLSYSISVDSAACNVCNGTAELNVFGGRRPYFFDWQTMADSVIITNDSVATGLCYNEYYLFTVNDGCNTFLTDTIFFDNCDSITSDITSYNSINAISISPNPNNGNFVLSYGTNNDIDGLVQIFNAQGAVVYREVLNEKSNRYRLIIENNAPGLYICTVTQGGVIRRLPFIIK
jgi:Secretion system C-terminal sorting domain/Dockerin type I domain/SprB repeat